MKTDTPRLAWRPTRVHKCIECPWRSGFLQAKPKERCDLENRDLPKVSTRTWTRIVNENYLGPYYDGEWGFPKWCPLLHDTAIPTELYQFWIDSHFFTQVPNEHTSEDQV